MSETPISSRLRRLRGEPASVDFQSQSEAFIRQCLEEGLGDDDIVMMAREHDPTKERFEQSGSRDGMIERVIGKLRDQGVGVGALIDDGARYLDWGDDSEGKHAITWCIEAFIEAGASVSLVGEAKVGKSLLALEA